MATKTKLTRSSSARPAPPTAPPIAESIPLWGYLLSFAVLLYALFEVYGPALHGPFVFDDLYLPYSKPQANLIPFRAWLGVRPFLGISFWTDFHLWNENTFPYHVTNLLLHFASAAVLYFVFRKLLDMAAVAEPKRTILSAFGAVLFLFHPIQTEVAAYVASRSEALSVLFFFCALSAFLYRKSLAIGWRSVAFVLFFFLLAVGSKEHTVTFPALLLLTDYFWNPGFSFSGIRANRRLYIPIAIAGTLGGVFIFRYVARDPMIGFHITGLGPGAYFLTQCRAIWVYVQLFLFPYPLTLDHDFSVSHSLLEHGAILALAGLILLVAAALYFRKRFPLAAYGWLAFLLLLSPTSSIIPINDVLVERRLYLPFFALVLVLFEPLRRARLRPLYLSAALGLLCCIAAFATWERSHVWGSVLELFKDAAAKSPDKARVHIGYANALYHQRRCKEAIEEYQIASHLKTTDHILYFNLASAYDCAHQTGDAIKALKRSIDLDPKANAYALLGKMLSEQGKYEESMAALETSLIIDSSFTPALALRGVVAMALGQNQRAFDDLTEALRRDPQNIIAQRGMNQLTQRR